MEIVYVLRNPEMPGLVKIGMTKGTIEARMRALDKTNVPVPFECVAAWKVEDAKKAETAIHKAFDDRRVRKSREFFRVPVEQPIAILAGFGIQDVTPRDDVVGKTDPDGDRAALERSRSRRENFQFKMVGIAPGLVLESIWDKDKTCVVRDDKKVEFMGDEMSLSAAAARVLDIMGKTWRSVSGPESWKHNGRTLVFLRDEQ